MSALVPARRRQINVAQNIGFGIIAAVMVFAAFRVVTAKNVVHAALWLVIVLAGVAAQYILAAAEFVGRQPDARLRRRGDGAVPVRHHAHARPDRRRARPQQPQLGLGHPGGADAARRAVVGGPSTPSATQTLPDRAARPRPRRSPTTCCRNYLVPFLALSFILLAAAIGAIVLARKD